VTGPELIAWLDNQARPQREKLAEVRGHVAMIRALHDDEHAAVVRTLKKRLGSPKLAGELAALLRELADRTPNPRPRSPAEPAPAPAPEPEPPPLPAPVRPDETAERLVAEIAADPEAQAPYIVYGDWLAARGDPRGELVTIGHALAKNPHHKAMLEAHRAHLAAHAERLLGPLASCEDLVTEHDWYMGFLRACRVAYTLDRYNDGPQIAIEDVIRWLVDAPGPARFLQKLTVGIVQFNDQNSYAGVGRVLANKPRPALRTLALGDFTYEETELNWSAIGDIDALWPQVPNLGSLWLRSGSLDITAIDLPRLESLEVVSGGLDAGSARAIAAAAWPALVKLSLMFGPGPRGGCADVAVVAPILAGARLPKLRKLGLANCDFTDELASLLPRAAILPQLEELDLSQGTLSDAGARILAGHRDKLAHLRLIVDENFLTPDGLELLRGTVATLVPGQQRSGPDRYAAMYE